MKAILVERLAHRFAASHALSAILGSGVAVGLGPLRLADLDPPRAPGPDWWRVRPILAGICGSDLSTVDGRSSRYFESIISFPFVLGHEIVGEVQDGPRAGDRVVVEPVLGCLTRGIDPPCSACSIGQKDACEHLAFGRISPGLQTGFCTDTGGGWSESLVAHDSQLHTVPEEMSDEDAVLVEPTACAIHAVLRAQIAPSERVIVIGAGTLGLLTTSALRAFSLPASLLVAARHGAQRRLAMHLGADVVADESELVRAARRTTASFGLAKSTEPRRLSGGADVVFDCVGSAVSLAQALSVVRPQGKIVLVGMPGAVKMDLAPLWHREVHLLGAYAYGTEVINGAEQATFDLAIEHARQHHLGSLVSAHYPLERYEEAIRHAATAGRRGAVKVVFDLRKDKTPGRHPLGVDESERQDA